MENGRNLEELLKLAKANDKDAKQTIIEIYTPFIKKIVRYYGLFLSRDDKEDLFIEALIATLKSIDAYSDSVGPFENFLFINIRNRILDTLRRQKREYPLEEALHKTYDFLDEFTIKEEIEEFKKKLTQKELEVFELYLRGFKISDIAEELKLSYKSIDNTLQRIKKKAKQFIVDSLK